jgi:uncharacterized protein DUF1579
MERELDFWLGEWDVRWEGGSGTNVISSELQGTVILERFDGRPGTTLQGISVSVFDRELAHWRQTWVDSHHGYLDFVGGVGDDGVFELRHEKRTDDCDPQQFRMRFTEVQDDSFVWLWQRREPTGDWSDQWRIDYRRRPR